MFAQTWNGEVKDLAKDVREFERRILDTSYLESKIDDVKRSVESIVNSEHHSKSRQSENQSEMMQNQANESKSKFRDLEANLRKVHEKLTEIKSQNDQQLQNLKERVDQKISATNA